MSIENFTNHELLGHFEDAICDKNYNPSSEDYNQSGFTYYQLLEEILVRMNNNYETN